MSSKLTYDGISCACANRLGWRRNVARVYGPFFAGEEKRVFAHARDSQEKLGIRIRVDIFRVLARNLPLYSRICTTDDGCLRMQLPIVSEQTLYKTRVDALCTCTYVAMHIVRDSKLVYFSGYVFRTLRLYESLAHARTDYTRPSILKAWNEANNTCPAKVKCDKSLKLVLVYLLPQLCPPCLFQVAAQGHSI